LSYDELDTLVRQRVETDRLPGVAIALVRGGETVWAQGYGTADIAGARPVTPDTIFSIQSVSKTIVATALMRLHEAGHFALNDRANEHLGDVQIVDADGAPVPATIRDLLTHSAGLPVQGAMPGGQFESLSAFLTTTLKTVRPPRTEIVYANYGFDAIGYLVERFSGRPYGDYLRDELCTPLEMSSTAVGAAADTSRRATGYFLSELDNELHPLAAEFSALEAMRAAGSIWSSVLDLAKFLASHISGDQRVISEATARSMHTLHATIPGATSGMGLGFRVDNSDGRVRICHGGDGPGSTAFIGAYPEQGAGVALLINRGRADSARSTIGNAALAHLLGDVPPSDGARPIAGAARYAGAYESNFWGIKARVRADEGGLSLGVEGGTVAGAGGRTSRLEAAGEHCFLAREGFFDGWHLTFAPDAASFSGGLYPWMFKRTGDAPAVTHTLVDEAAELAGRWQGTVASPLGELPLALDVSDGGLVTALTAHDEPLQAFRAERGRVEGEFDADVPGFGKFRVFLRLAALDGTLAGKTYARGDFGEFEMPTELRRP
jgi:CubicO group peptidase (beta-lactamase class C family)